MSDDGIAAGEYTAFRHPVLAVACPDCRKGVGVMCVRPSGHRAADFRRARKTAADAAFIARHGADASIERTRTGWVIDPGGHARATTRTARGADPPLFSRDSAQG
jgi:hypothetical protein